MYIKSKLFWSVQFLSVLFLFIGSVSMHAQQLKLRFTDVPLTNILEEITNQTGYRFVYSDALKVINEKKSFSIDANHQSLKEVLNKLFDGKGISYTIEGKQIVLAPDSIVIKNSETTQPPHSVKIGGRIHDDVGEPLPGVTIENKTTGKLAASDFDGKYSIEAKEGDMIFFASIGMADYKSIVGKGDILNIVMKPSAIALDDVVVTGFQTLSKERVTGSFAKVGAQDLNKYTATSLGQKLQTSMNGVFVKSNGEIEIRGLSTLNTADGKAEPLVVVDGFPIEGGLSMVNPNDVENITILRDAASASIYGIKSANGVIIVTTKEGSREKFTVNANVDYSFSAKPDMSYLNKMDAAGAVGLQWEVLNKGFMDQVISNPYNYYSELANIYLAYKSGDQTALARKDKLASYGNLMEEQYGDLLMQRELTGQYGISISGGGKNAQYYVSGRIEDAKKYLKGNDGLKLFLDARMKLNITDKLEVNLGINTNYSSGESNSPVSIYSLSRNSIPFEPLELNGVLQPLSGRSTPVNFRDKARALGLLPAAIEYNPVNDLRSLNNRSNSNYNRYQVGLSYKLDLGLKIDVKYQYEDGHSEVNNIYSPQTYKQAEIINKYAEGQTADGVLFNIGKDKSSLKKSVSDWDSHLIRGLLSYNREINKKHYISAMAGAEIQMVETKYVNENYSTYDPIVGVILPDIDKLTKGIVNWSGGRKQYFNISDHLSFKNSSAVQRYVSFFFNGGYSFLSKYNVTGSFRIDQSNIFGTDSKFRYKPMWSVGASWNMNKESFLSGVKWINNLTVRGTYGLTGMIDKSTSPYIIIAKDKDDYLGEYASFPNSPNPNLRWEQTKNFNIGVDYSFINNRMKGYVEFYNKYTTDVIAPKESDPTNGFPSIVANTAEISNRGVDFNINSVNIDRKVRWTTSLNFSMNFNKIEKLYSNSGLDANYFVAGTYVREEKQEGKPINQIFSYNYAGLDKNGSALIYDRYGKLIAGSDNTAKLYKEDLIYSGTSQAPYFGNMTNTLSYNNFSLNFSLVYYLGHYSRKDRYDSEGYMSGFQNIYNDRWQKPGDEVFKQVPAVEKLSNSSSYYTYGSANIFDASNIRLKYVSLQYSLPQNILRTLRMQEVTFRVQAENLGFIWRADKSGIDIDAHSLEGIRYGIPALKTFTLGVSIKL